MTLKRQAITEEKNNFGAVALNSYIIFVELPIIGKKIEEYNVFEGETHKNEERKKNFAGVR